MEAVASSTSGETHINHNSKHSPRANKATSSSLPQNSNKAGGIGVLGGSQSPVKLGSNT